ncbi:helix-turn-helix domain-containing protein [Hydrogenimonas thermophila]|uniref:helix-turn-helix domain-containing protein n=1 Tax=Hydrogenimonas thermophila TaxID=223786 RepID=UPI0029372959|nr:helix-turn-helix domain-containing protein [Hydrogenimonas thermophila]WOE69125.1 helix-turn-helix domain-containing protein [Hydrogenimonas thermophila]WOE71635.1 helix-turn-helix domain-containing protein [Hydrogenimonas thermophila]
MRKIDPILTRIKSVLNAKNDREMCEKWGISYSTLDTWKNRDKIPEKRLLDFSLKYGVSLDWLLTGKGEPTTFKNINIGQIGIGGVGDNHQYTSHQNIAELDHDILTILDYLLEMPKEKRKKVLKFILSM